MRRSWNFKPLLWLLCFVISCLTHEKRVSFRPDYEQYRTRRNIFYLRIVVKIHEPCHICKDEHAARVMMLSSWSFVIIIGLLYNAWCTFCNLIWDDRVRPLRRAHLQHNAAQRRYYSEATRRNSRATKTIEGRSTARWQAWIKNAAEPAATRGSEGRSRRVSQDKQSKRAGTVTMHEERFP